MKIQLIYLFLIVTASCVGTKNQASDERAIMPPPHVNCPEDGDCSFEILENSVLNLSYGQDGKLNPQVHEGDKIVIRYRYKRSNSKDAMDSSYSEYVYLEIDPDQSPIILKDEELKKVKMTFGRICYCKGAMGYFPVLQGQLFIFNKRGNLQIRSTFKVGKVPQITEQIDENINY
jgi:hypothetical protein